MSFQRSFSFHFCSQEATSLFFGFELEVENQGGDKYALEHGLEKNHRYLLECKGDGSLNDGREIVSQPLSWNFIQENKEAIAQMLAYVRKSQFDSENSCGLHVHVSKSGLGGGTLERMQEFVYGNPEFVHLFTTRSMSNLQRWAYLYKDKDFDYKFGGRAYPTGHYAALDSCARNDTVEFRIFRSTLRPSEFFRALEFCHAVISFCQETRLYASLKPANFKKFIDEHCDNYPHIYDFLIENRKAAKMTAVAPVDEVMAPALA